jgi:DNA-binding transcriptional LysR family regulator
VRLRHIEVFSAIMLTGSTNGAAKLLHISQPAISKMLQHAEQSAGFALFLRSKGKLVPTPEALRLREELGPFDEQLKRIRRLVTSLAHGAERPLRIAATPALAHHVLPQVMARWCRAFPQSRCELTVAHTREIEHALLLDEIELGLTMRPVSHPNLLATPVRESALCAIAPAGWWPDALLDTPLVPNDLAGQPLITIDTDDYLGALLSNWLADADAGEPPQSRLSVQTYSLAKSLVEQRIGLALVDSFTANYPADPSRIQVRPLAIDATLQVYALTEHTRPPPQTAERLIQFLRDDGAADAAL